jgi:hypothetical protein
MNGSFHLGLMIKSKKSVMHIAILSLLSGVLLTFCACKTNGVFTHCECIVNNPVTIIAIDSLFFDDYYLIKMITGRNDTLNVVSIKLNLEHHNKIQINNKYALMLINKKYFFPTINGLYFRHNTAIYDQGRPIFIPESKKYKLYESPDLIGLYLK